MTVGKVFAADDAYDSNAVFECLAVYNGIYLPCIKVRRNARIKKTINNTLRNLSVKSQE